MQLAWQSLSRASEVWQKFDTEEEAKSFCDSNEAQTCRALQSLPCSSQDCIGYHVHPYTKMLGSPLTQVLAAQWFEDVVRPSTQR